MSHLWRLYAIVWVMAKFHLDDYLPDAPGTRLLRITIWLLPIRWLPAPGQPHQRLRLACEQLGPVFIKLGQLLSTRHDLLSAELASELACLQDRVPPFDRDVARAIVEQELGQPVTQLFARFDREALASASVAQVHTAQLHDGREVIIKIIRPGMGAAILRDMALLRMLANILENFWADARLFHPVRVVEDYTRTLLDEVDLRLEAENTRRLRHNFDTSTLLYVPWVEASMVTAQVMVAERIHGVPISDLAAIEAAGIDRRVLAERGLEIFFTQVFRDNFFHADMHPGNVFVALATPETPQYIALDCAVIGSLNRSEQMAIARMGLALIQRDYAEITAIALESGWIPSHQRRHANDIERALRRLADPIFERPLNEVDFAGMLMQLFALAREYHLEVPVQLMLLLKTLVHVEGLGGRLYPGLDIFRLGEPMLKRWLADRMGPETLLKSFALRLPQWLAALPDVPSRIDDALQGLAQTPLYHEHQQHNLREISRELRRTRWLLLAVMAVTVAVWVVR